MTKKILIILSLLLAGGILLWKFAPRAGAPSSNLTETSIVGAALNADGDFEYKKETEFLTVEATYPAQTSLAADADAKTRATMEAWVVERIGQFEANVAEMLDPAEKARLAEQGRKYAMGIQYERYASPEYVSYVYLIYEDTGGAHPNAYYATFVFDVSGAKVELSGLFKPGGAAPETRYLDRLSKISYDYLVRDLAARFGSALDEGQLEWVRMGTAPSPETLQFFYLDGADLVLIFPPYQVAAYAAGKSEVYIPRAEIADILK